MKTGIWIDKRQAFIINLVEGALSMNTISSEIEDFHVGGGSGTKFKGGPQDVVQDSKYLMREKQQFKKYFEALIPYLKQAKHIVIFGPAETGKKLQKELLENYHNVATRIKGVVKADSMTDNQMKQWVKNYFENVNSTL